MYFGQWGKELFNDLNSPCLFNELDYYMTSILLLINGID